MRFRKPTVDDLLVIEQIQNENGRSHWSQESIKSEILEARQGSLLALDPKGAVTGFIFIRPVDQDREITFMAIQNRHRRQGIAKALIHEAIATCKKEGAKRLLLEVSLQNLAALTLYSSLGFKEGRIRRQYYADGTDAIEMSLDL